MRVSEIISVLDAEILTGGQNLDMDIQSACGSDLMSDVMAYVKDSILLLTGLANPQVIRTAEMMDIKVIIFVRGKNPGENVVNLAAKLNMTVLTTRHPMFIACGMLYNAGLTGRGVWD